MTDFRDWARRAAGCTAASMIAMALPAQADTQWNMAAAWSGGPYLEQDAKGFARLVGELTDGAVTIQVFPGGTLGKASDVTETVRSGAAQVGHTWMSYDWGIDATAVLFGGSPGQMTPEEMILWMYKGGGLELSQDYRKEKFGVVSLPCGSAATEIFLHSNRPVETTEDLKGLKLRTAGAWAEIAGRLEVSTVGLPGSEVYTALERGVIDATEWGTPSVNIDSGLPDVSEYIVVPGFHSPGGIYECVINEDAWDALSDHERSMVEMAARLALFESWMSYAYDDAVAFSKLMEEDRNIIHLGQDVIEDAQAVTTAWEDEKAAADPEWFGRVLESRRGFKTMMDRTWTQFRFPIGAVPGAND
ncbi:TRAP transporter substrate-binding protein DctP [Roseovarius sp.]|uniref:TRAP transporter substrate-binding protein DctP n=1 Tax=Roseovarius sp. TaxID=1486281 RepID=UPI003B5BA1CB